MKNLSNILIYILKHTWVCTRHIQKYVSVLNFCRFQKNVLKKKKLRGYIYLCAMFLHSRHLFQYRL